MSAENIEIKNDVEDQSTSFTPSSTLISEVELSHLEDQSISFTPSSKPILTEISELNSKY